MSSEIRPPQVEAGKIYIYKIFDHCGCSVNAPCISGNIIGDVYYSYMCDICYIAMSRERYSFILNFFNDDKKYKVKDLLDKKGWIDEKTWANVMRFHKHNIRDFFNYGERVLELYCTGMLK